MNSSRPVSSSKLSTPVKRPAKAPAATRPLVWRAKVQYRAGIRARRDASKGA